jgi:hypothetical protein
MAKKSAVKAPEIAKYKPSIHFGSEDGLELPDGDVGDHVRMTVHGKIASKSEHDHGEGPRSSMSVEIHKLEHGSKGKEGMIDDGAADGAKGAMDHALKKLGGHGKKKPKKDAPVSVGGKVEDGDE